MNIYNTIEATLKQPIGRNLIDSGGIYGYQYQRNQNIDFATSERVNIDFNYNPKDSSDVCAVASLYHYLTEWLSIDETSKRINKWIEANEIHWTGELLDAIDSGSFPIEIDNDPYEINTYNGEQMLSQVIQYFVFNDDYVALQVHNGCDVRSGYTPVKIYNISRMDYDVFGFVQIYGEIDGQPVDTHYDGFTLLDENGNAVPLRLNKDGDVISKINLDFI